MHGLQKKFLSNNKFGGTLQTVTNFAIPGLVSKAGTQNVARVRLIVGIHGDAALESMVVSPGVSQRRIHR